MILYEEKRSGNKEYIYHQKSECLNFQKHIHYSYEIVFVLDGVIECEIENTSYKLEKDSILIIFPGQIHSYFTEKYSKTYLCVFSNDLVGSFYNKTKGKRLTNPVIKSENVKRYTEKLSADNNIFFKQAIFFEICAKALEQSALEDENIQNLTLTSSIAFYVQNNYAKGITLKDFATEYGYNYTYLSAFFSKNFKCNFASYVNRFRLDHAVELLETTDKTITEISIECGYNTIRNFNTAFKNSFNVTPSEYRKNRKSYPDTNNQGNMLP